MRRVASIAIGIVLLGACMRSAAATLSPPLASEKQEASPMATAPSTYPMRFWAVQFLDDKHGFVTASLGPDWSLLRTKDGGRTWTKVTLPTSVAEFQFVTPQVGWLLTGGCTGSDGKLSTTCRSAVLRTTNGGESWTELTERGGRGFGSPPLRSLRFVDEANGWILEQGGVCKPIVCENVLRTTDGGRSWNLVTHAPLLISGLVAVDTTHLWAFGSAGILFSADGGNTWTTQFDPASPSSRPPTIRGIDFADAHHGWALTFDGSTCTASSCGGYVLYATDDGGAHWAIRATGAAFDGCGGQLMTPHFTNLSSGWIGANHGAGGAGTRFGVLVSGDGGRTWTCHSSPIAFEAVESLDADRAWAIGDRNGTSVLLRTESRGATWADGMAQTSAPSAPPVPSSRFVIVAGSLQSKPASSGPVRATETQLWRVSALAVDPRGDLFIGEVSGCAKAQYCASRVRRIDAGTGLIEPVAGTGQAGYEYDNKRCCRGSGADATTTYLGLVNALALDRFGRVYIGASDPLGNGAVWRVDPTTKRIELIAGGPAGVSSAQDAHGGDEGPATHAVLFGVWSLAVDDAGDVLIGEGGGYRIRKVTPNGTINTIAGTGGLRGYAQAGHAGTETPMYGPSALALASDGSLYFAESTANRVRRLDPSGIVQVAAGTGEIGSSGDGGPATLARLDQPRAFALDAAGRLYIAESSVVRRVELDGTIRTVINGNGGLIPVSAMAIGPDGALYLADGRYPLVRRVIFDDERP